MAQPAASADRKCLSCRQARGTGGPVLLRQCCLPGPTVRLGAAKLRETFQIHLGKVMLGER